MRKYLLLCSVALGSVVSAWPAAAAPWVRGFVVDNYEPAFYYGGKGGTDVPGSDCPKGAIPDNDYRTLLTTKWRSEAEIAPLLIKAGDEKTAEAAQATHVALERAISYRGFRRDIEVYINPFAAPDPGMQQVTGKIAEGFNLDGDAKTGGFTSPGGERGIDNAFYRAWGCTQSYRDLPYHAYLSQRGNDKMLDGLYTMVIRLMGSKDPMNDDDVTMEVGYSPDHAVKGGNGGVVRDYSFRLVKGAQYTRLKAHIKNGVVETEQVADLRLPEFSWFPANAGEADFKKGRMRFAIGADGAVATGLIGGYRDWRDLYGKDAFNQGQYEPTSATTRETLYHQNEIGMYYALKRNADALPDPKTGQNTAISITYRFTAKPAYVVDPAMPMGVTAWQPKDVSQRAIAADYRGRFLRAQATKQIMPEPPQPAARGRKLPPQDLGKKPAAQVSNGAPAAVASAVPAPPQ